MSKEKVEETTFEDEDQEDLEYDDEEDEDEEDYEEMTEEQLEELNKLSANVNDPFGSRQFTPSSLSPAPAPKPAPTTGPTLAELMALNLKIEADKKAAAATAASVANEEGDEDGEGEWINGEEEEGEEGEEGEDMETMTLSHAKRTASHLVIDTNAIIQSSTRFDTLAKVLWTVEEVIDEVKDKRSIDYLASLPYEIKTKEPSGESLRAVIEFSKLTGDYPSLSPVDIKVLALAHTLHCQYEKNTKLRSEPLPLQVNANGVQRKVNDQTNGTTTTNPSATVNTNNNSSNGDEGGVKFIISDTRNNANRKNKFKVVPASQNNNNNNNNNGEQTKNKKKKNKKKKNKTATTDTATATAINTDSTTTTGDKCCDHDHDHDHKHTDKPIEVPSSASLYSNNEQQQQQQQPSTKKNKKKNSLLVNLDDLKDDDKPIIDGKAILEQMKLQKQKEEEEKRRNKRNEADMDAEDGWITQDNIRDKMDAEDGSKAEKKHVSVALITSDFPMQNVMLQMGLHLFTVNGLVIKQVSQFVLKCFSCLKTTNDMKTQWCQHCGNRTMVKAMKFIDRNGNVSVGKGSGRQFNLRGKKYSIPKMKGGQKHSDIVLSEEQYIHRMKATGLFYRKRAHERKLEKAMESGDLERFETILGNDPGNNVKVGYGKINPNIARRKIGKKNKSILNK